MVYGVWFVDFGVMVDWLVFVLFVGLLCRVSFVVPF